MLGHLEHDHKILLQAPISGVHFGAVTDEDMDTMKVAEYKEPTANHKVGATSKKEAPQPKQAKKSLPMISRNANCKRVSL